MNQGNPVQLNERIVSLDIIRGFAILGIFIVNMGMMNTPYIYLYMTNTQLFTGIGDQIADALIIIFAQGKFYTTFSFLFGLGFILFVDRAKLKVAQPNLLFLRRLIILFLIGVVHAFLLWYGDVLMTYAVFGLLLLAFYNAKPRTFILWACSLLCCFILLTALGVGLTALSESIDPQFMESQTQEQVDRYEAAIVSSLHAYGEGTFAEVMSQRIADVQESIPSNFTAILLFFPLFLLGAYTGKRRIFQQVEQHLSFIRKVWLGGLLIGLSLNLLKYWSLQHMDSLQPTVYNNYHAMGTAIGDTAFSLFYITSIVLLLRVQTWQKWLAPLAYVGRTAISNYLFQSIVGTTILYSYGLGLYGKVGPLLGLVLTFVIFGIQIILSKLWLQSYQFGPVEWVWRSLTYGKLQPLRKK